MTNKIEVSIPAVGQPLAGTFFPASNGNTDKPLLICPATGITQKFYFPFARWLAHQGFSVLVFDYRGIGKSLQESHVKHCEVKKQDWGLYDMPAALDFLLELTGQNGAYLVGHSAGGQLFGLMHN
ncbi:alpha/beta hydrolase, partial [Limnobacter sp. SAORIC-690]|uniref:alpha/beta fold hydrolase n=2 Tax=unclassified Limnobacter TaxID=2630203 RepID=UPI000D420C5E